MLDIYQPRPAARRAERTALVFIYALCDPTNMTVRYVGKAKSVADRFKSHRNDKRSTRKCRWIAALRRGGIIPVVRILEQVDDEQWEERERHWIATFRAVGCDLTNHTDGGEGRSGMGADERAVLGNLMRERMSNPGFRSRVYTSARAKKISAALKGRPKTREHVVKLPQNRPGRRLSEETKRKISANWNGHRWTPDEIRKMNTGNRYAAGNSNTRGRVMPEHEKLARSAALEGRVKTPEHREAIRASALRRWARERNRNVDHAANG